MIIRPQNGINPTTETCVKSSNDLKIKELKYEVPVYVVVALKQTRYKGVKKGVALASFYSKEKAESLFSDIKSSIDNGIGIYEIPGKSVWEGYNNELIPGVRV